jgi:hypothetical protein
MTQATPRAGLLGRLVLLSRHTELLIVIILSAATLLTSWAGYQAALWGGAQATSFGLAASQRARAVRVASRADQLESVDIFLFSQWLNAYAAGDERLQSFYRERFRPEFAPVFEAWLATKPYAAKGGPATPFVTKGYRVATRDQADQIDRKAEDTFGAGRRALHISESFIGVTVILASAMFFAGICQAFHTPKLRLTLAAVSLLTCAWGAIEIFSLPAH